MPKELSLVMPFYNEEKNVEWVLEDMIGTLQSKKIDFELVCVQNGSWDSTSDLLKKEAQKTEYVPTIPHFPDRSADSEATTNHPFQIFPMPRNT